MTPLGVNGKPLEEYDIRKWFTTVDLAQATDTFHVVAGIIETRKALEPKYKPRKRRSDAGTRRTPLLNADD